MLLRLVVLGLQLANTLVLSYSSNEEQETCLLSDISPGAVPWMSNLTGSVELVEWGYGKINCSNEESCFGLNMTQNAQLHPLEIQEGVSLWFVAENLGFPFEIQPYKVSEEQFNSCDGVGGQPIIDGPTSQKFMLEDQFLSLGSNYFIANTNRSFFQCQYGLKLNVTVKPNNCHFPSAPEGMFCMDHGHCITHHLIQGAYTCLCCGAYSGPYCDELDGCHSNPCGEGSSCVDKLEGYSGTSYVCECPPGKTGDHCEIAIDECSSNPCLNGICVDKDDAYECFCIPGYGGQNCEMQYNECMSKPCLSGGFCIDLINDYKCECGPGWTGHHCEVKVDLCANDPCHNSTHCLDLGNSFNCFCQTGFTGRLCEENINDCDPNPCSNGGKCEDLVNSFKCHCAQHYSGSHCQDYTGSPPEEISESPDRSLEPRLTHVKTLYIITGCLAATFIFVIVVLAACIYRIHRQRGGYRNYDNHSAYSLEESAIYENGERIHKAIVNVDSASLPGPSVQAIYEATSLDYQNNLQEPLVASLRPKKV